VKIQRRMGRQRIELRGTIGHCTQFPLPETVESLAHDDDTVTS
jgi:hypothetical protein